MAITLEQQRLANPEPLQRGVLEILERTNPILQRLPFRNITGNSYSYRVETNDLGSVQWRAVNEGYTEDHAIFEKRSASLAILGGEVFVDRFLALTSPVEDMMAEQLAIKTKLMGRQFTRQFLSGDVTKEPNGFDGLDKLVAEDQIMDMTENELTLADLHEFMDLVPNANLIVTSRSGRREMQRVFDIHPSYLTVGTNNFGAAVESFAGIPIAVVDDELAPSRETGDTTGTVSDFYLVELGAESLCGIQNGNGVSVRNLGEIDERPGFLSRLEWYVSIMQQQKNSAARLVNVLHAV